MIGADRPGSAGIEGESSGIVRASVEVAALTDLRVAVQVTSTLGDALDVYLLLWDHAPEGRGR